MRTRRSRLNHLQGVVVGEDPREGFVRNGVYYHPELRFQFPVLPSWKVKNERASVLMLDPNQRVLMVFELAPAKSAAEAAQKLSRVPGVQIVQSKPTRIGGLNAHAVEAVANTQQGKAAILDYFIELDGKVYSFLGYTGMQSWSSSAPLFLQTVTGFARLTDRGILEIQPARLAIIQADRDAPFSSFMPRQLPLGMPPEELAILNQVRPDETIRVGQRLKLPR